MSYKYFLIFIYLFIFIHHQTATQISVNRYQHSHRVLADCNFLPSKIQVIGIFIPLEFHFQYSFYFSSNHNKNLSMFSFWGQQMIRKEVNSCCFSLHMHTYWFEFLWSHQNLNSALNLLVEIFHINTFCLWHKIGCIWLSKCLIILIFFEAGNKDRRK